MDVAAKNNDEHSSSAEKHMAAAMYSGLISHSDTSDEVEEDLGILGRDKKSAPGVSKRDEDVSEDDKELDCGADDDPDFMASDTPAEEF